MWRRAAATGLALMVAGCQANPKLTVLNLDTTDRRWTSRKCVEARRAVFLYNDGERLRGLAGLANHLTPYAGTAAVSLMSWRKDPERARLNERVRIACVSPPKRAAAPGAPKRQASGAKLRNRKS